MPAFHTRYGDIAKLTSIHDIIIEPKIYKSGVIEKGSMKEISLSEPSAKLGYTRHNFLGEISGVGSNSAITNLHYGSITFYAPIVTIDVTIEVVTMYVRD